MSPSAKISGWPGSDRSGSTGRGPPRSSSAPGALGQQLRQRRGGDAGGPDDVACRSARSRRRRTSVTDRASRPTIVLPVRTVTPSRSSDRRAFSDSSGGKAARMRRPASISRIARRAGSMRAEVGAQRVAGDLGDRAGQLDAGRPAADDDEREPGARRRSGRLELGGLERAAGSRRRISGASSSDFRPGRERLPLVVTEVVVARAGGDDQGVVGRPAASSPSRAAPARAGGTSRSTR